MPNENELLRALCCPLPENIAWRKGQGDFHGAKHLIKAALSRDLPELLRRRLQAELLLIDRLPDDYPDTFGDLLAQLQERIPGFTAHELHALEDGGWLDYIVLDGEKRYFDGQCSSLLKANPSVAARAGRPHTPRSPLLDAFIAQLKEKGEIACRTRVRASVSLREDAFRAGETYRVHLPIAAKTAQQSDIRLIASSDAPAHIADEAAPQRTVFFEQQRMENKPFTIEYEYTARIRYFDPARPRVLYPDAPAPTQDDLAPDAPHLLVTPLIRSVADEAVKNAKTPLAKARALYDYVTTNIVYSFMREYQTIENGAEYALLNGKGDCGIQALLFIALCRACGIPARWQSGLFTEPGDVGSHDWAQFYTDETGWLFADCSFGGSAYRRGAAERWNFYFGNLDIYRMAANSRYYTPFDPPSAFLRADPYDSQRGEIETPARGLKGSEYTASREVTAQNVL